MSGVHKRPSSQAHVHSLVSSKRIKTSSAPASDQTSTVITDDPLEQDVGVGASRKKEVKLDGYASDSSEEGHGVTRTSTMSKTKTSLEGDDDDDDDMFGEAPSKQIDDDENDASLADRKETYMTSKDIEGQDFSTRSEFMDIVDEDDDNEDDDDDSVDEEVGALGRKKNAPKMDGFNMTVELEEGKFDADGNYIRTARDHKDNQDNWLKDVSRKDIAAARDAVEQRERQEAERVQGEHGDQATVGELLSELVAFLDRGETLLECLARLGSSSRPKRRKEFKKKGKIKEDADVRKIERMTELANKLMAKTNLEVYDTERESLMRAYKKETGEDLPVPSIVIDDKVMQDQDTSQSAPKAWEFVWAGAEDQINGPYDTSTMRAWLSDGLLQSETSVALVRRVGEISFVEANELVLMD